MPARFESRIGEIYQEHLKRGTVAPVDPEAIDAVTAAIAQDLKGITEAQFARYAKLLKAFGLDPSDYLPVTAAS